MMRGDNSMWPSAATCYGSRRKPADVAEHAHGTHRPAAYKLRDSSGRLLREWKNGARMRDMARNYGVRVSDVEDIIRGAA